MSLPVDTPYGKASGDNLPPYTSNIVSPGDAGMLAWTFDPVLCSSTFQPTGGTLYLAKMFIREQNEGALNFFWGVTTPGATPTAGQNWAGLYSASRTLIGSSNIDSKVDDDGMVEGSINPGGGTVGVRIPNIPTFVWAALLFNAATTPTIVCGNTTFGDVGLANFGLFAFNSRYASAGTGLTTLPNTLGAFTHIDTPFFVALTAL